jgi:Tfp pilus assembly protein PilX
MFLNRNMLGNQKGQALLIVVLVMVIVLTVGLSIATRTIINLRNTNEQASSQKALSAAEAGVEQAIKNDTPPGTFTNNFSASSVMTTVSKGNGAGSFLLSNGTEVPQNDAIYVWVAPFSSDPAQAFTQTWSGDMTIYWNNEIGDCTISGANTQNVAALEVSVIYGSKDSPKLARYAYDPCSVTRVPNNHFTTTPTVSQSKINVSGKDLYYNVTMNGLVNVLLVRINPVYSGTVIGVSGSNPLAAQGKTITSVGTSGQNTTRKITVFEGYPEVPSVFFPYNLFQPR